MNQKAQIATVVAVLLGVFLVVITAIKFDWVGKVVRGEQIIKFNKEEVADKDTNSNKDQTNNDNSNQEDENQEMTDETTISCNYNSFSNNVTTIYEVKYVFKDKKLQTSTYLMNAAYMDVAGKPAFDSLVSQYQDLSSKYQAIVGFGSTSVVDNTKYDYTLDIDYNSVDEAALTAQGLPVLTPAKDASMSDVEKFYTDQGYTCHNTK